MNIPRAAIPFILYQRTGYLVLSSLPFFGRLFGVKSIFGYHRIIRLESALFATRIRALFEKDMAAEYESIRASLPSSVGSILDIGCGMAGIDVLLARHYADRSATPEIHLLDKTAMDESVHYGFEQNGSFYNSLPEAARLLNDNGVDSSHVHAHRVEDGFPAGRFDLVISLISWGFHYPIAMYRDAVAGCLTSGGALIVDVRRDSGGHEALAEVFDIEVIESDKKSERIKAMLKTISPVPLADVAEAVS